MKETMKETQIRTSFVDRQ